MRNSTTEDPFAFATAVNIGMIEEISSVFKSGINESTCLVFGHTADAHATDGNAWNRKICFSKFEIIHKVLLWVNREYYICIMPL